MKYNPLSLFAYAILTVAFPTSVLADVTGTQTLAANTALSLDTGATSSSGGDILWSGTAMTPQGKATDFNFGVGTPASFAALTQVYASTLGQFFTNAPLPASTLVLDDVFFVYTNGGNYAKVLVTAVSATSITLQFDTFSSSSGSSGPTITQVLNNYGLIPAGFSNAGIAQGSLFIIKGSGLADPTAQAVLQSSASGLPSTLNGASVTVTVNGTTTNPVFYYAIAAQLALVLPSSTPVGTGTVTVKYNGQSASAPIQVVQTAMGFDAYYGTGSGLGVATNNATGALYNYSSSIPPGTTVVLWGSGLGADPQRDSKYVPAAFSINNLAHVYIGGVDSTIVYQGASGYPGLNQVDVTIPNGVTPGCNVSLVGVNSAGVPTNFITLPIGSGACSDPTFGASGSQLQTLSGKATVNTGAVFIAHVVGQSATGATQTTDVAEAIFESEPGASYGSSSGSVSIPGCIVSQTTGTATTTTTTALDAGTITMTGPVNGTVTLTHLTVSSSLGVYEAQLAAGSVPSTGGTFTFNGSGGTAAPTPIGPFTTSVVIPNPILNWTNQSAAATVTRSQGLLVQWTGGASGTYVLIGGSSSSTTSGLTGSYTCIVPISYSQFTVPSYVLNALPAGTGTTGVSGYTNYKSFTATNLDVGTAIGYTGQNVNSTVN